jgi:hypothetical protein
MPITRENWMPLDSGAAGSRDLPLVGRVRADAKPALAAGQRGVSLSLPPLDAPSHGRSGPPDFLGPAPAADADFPQAARGGGNCTRVHDQQCTFFTLTINKEFATRARQTSHWYIHNVQNG